MYIRVFISTAWDVYYLFYCNKKMTTQEISASLLEDLDFFFTQQDKPVPNIDGMVRELRSIKPGDKYYDCDAKRQFVEKYTSIISQQ